ncbi:hypothetical protein CTI12_AA606810 [Artemisia annua]|uniref:Uncharacterized protein n=1 Tax=Artemisia annua TaxID=35608 RepID=A0A2U1KFS1_ARTAN|nr:hypothetical protein CTI12_AA606810 [Artemisia annua]
MKILLLQSGYNKPFPYFDLFNEQVSCHLLCKREKRAKENPNRSLESWQKSETPGKVFYQEFGKEKKGWNSNGTSSPAPSSGVNGTSVSSSGSNFSSVDSGSWDDWDNDANMKYLSTITAALTNANDWAGWDDVKDDGFDKFDGKSTTGKSDGNWSWVGVL